MTNATSSWITDLAEYLIDANFVDGNVFAYEMAEGISPAAMIVPPLNGLPFDLDLPTRYRGEYQCIVRTENLADAHQLASDALQLLSLENVTVGQLRVIRSIALSTPVVYPRSDSDYYEASINLEITMVDPRVFVPHVVSAPVRANSNIKIFYDLASDSLFVSSSSIVYPDRSLMATQVGDLITVSIARTGATVVGPKNYQYFVDEDGESFASAALVLQYLNEQFAANDRAADGNASLLHTQTLSSAKWIIQHNFGADPAAVSVYVDGVQVEAQVDPIDNNRLEVNFLSPQVGTAVLKK